MDGGWPERIEAALGQTPVRVTRLGGGCVADVRRLEMADGRILVAKRSPGGGLAAEGAMLAYLAGHSALPVPAVRFCADDLLIMAWLPGGGALDVSAQHHAAELVAALHGVRGPGFGFEHDTVIGGLPQPNPRTGSWIGFFREHRLLAMARAAYDAGRLPKDLTRRVEQFAGRVDRYLEEPDHPSLIHGDLWGGNVLAQDGRITGFIDPAIYWADPEIELAFGTLFGTFDRAFFDRYNEIRPIRPGFFEVRRDIYNLYPLLVHVRLFGGTYTSSVSRILQQFDK